MGIDDSFDVVMQITDQQRWEKALESRLALQANSCLYKNEPFFKGLRKMKPPRGTPSQPLFSRIILGNTKLNPLIEPLISRLILGNPKLNPPD